MKAIVVILLLILAVVSFGVYDQHREFVKQDAQREADRRAAAQAELKAKLDATSREIIIRNCGQLSNSAARESCIANGLAEAGLR